MLMSCMEFITSSLPLSPLLRKLPCIYPQCHHFRPCQPTTLQSPMKTPSRSHTAAPCLSPLAASHSHTFLKDFQSGLLPSHGSLQTVDFFISVSSSRPIPVYPLGPSGAVHGLRPYCSQGLTSAPPTLAHSSSSGPRTGEPCPMGQVALVLSYLFLAFLFYLFTT